MSFYIKGFAIDEGRECFNDVYWSNTGADRNGYKLVVSHKDAATYKTYTGAVRAWSAMHSKNSKNLRKYEWKIISIDEISPENSKEPQR